MFDVRVIATCVILIIAVLILLLDSSANNAGPGWLWSGGKRDPFRRLLFHADGSLRRYAKASTIAWLLLMLALLWFVVPTDAP